MTQYVMTLWDTLRISETLARITNLMTCLYPGTESAIKCERKISRFFPLKPRMRQGSIAAPSLLTAE